MTYSTDSAVTTKLLDRAAMGDTCAFERLLAIHRPYLKRVIEMRMDPALRSRVDASDVVQEAQVTIAKGIEQFITDRPTSFRIWIRRKGLDRLADQRRRHIVAIKRSVLTERSISDVSSIEIACNLLSNTPSKILGQIEFRERVHSLIEQLGKRDCEMLQLRHAEDLTNAEVADLLEIDPNTARQRYGRAIRRLHQLFTDNGIGIDGEKE